MASAGFLRSHGKTSSRWLNNTQRRSTPYCSGRGDQPKVVCASGKGFVREIRARRAPSRADRNCSFSLRLSRDAASPLFRPMLLKLCSREVRHVPSRGRLQPQAPRSLSRARCAWGALVSWPGNHTGSNERVTAKGEGRACRAGHSRTSMPFPRRSHHPHRGRLALHHRGSGEVEGCPHCKSSKGVA